MPGDNDINAHHPAYSAKAESIHEAEAEPYSPITTIRDSIVDPTSFSETTTARESMVDPEFVAPAAARKSQFIAGPSMDRTSVIEPLFTPPAEGEEVQRQSMLLPPITPGIVSPMTPQGMGREDVERASHFFAL